MINLPFYKHSIPETVVIGTTDTLEIKKIKDITLAESIYVKDKLKDIDDSSIVIAKLAQKVAKAENIPPKLAASILWGLKDDEVQATIKELKLKITPQVIRDKFYTDILQATQAISEFAETRKKACIEALIYNRLAEKDENLTKEILSEISNTLADAIFDFWNKEESHWEDLGKSQPESNEQKTS